MEKKYYIKNISWGLFCGVLFAYLLRQDIYDGKIYVVMFLLASTILYPFSKKMIERM